MEKVLNKRQIGSKYEELAAAYLVKKGYKIIEKNYHAGRYGELDIIAEDEEGTLVICECKYRSKSKWQDPSAAVDVKKQRQICRTALYYCMKRGYGVEHPCRFAVIAIYGDESIRHIENAVEFRR